MTGKTLKELPYYERPDLTPYLIHLTKRSAKDTALENLISILKSGVIEGTDRYVQRAARPTGSRVACFMDVPFTALKYVCSSKNATRYQPYGVVVQKRSVYKQKGRPVLYLSSKECEQLDIPLAERWRVVSLEYDTKTDTWIDWQHEREWRCPGEFKLNKAPFVALVQTVKEVSLLQKAIERERQNFKALPLTIVPLGLICQGFGS